MYSYYHYISSCGIRFRAGQTNDDFARELRKFVPRPGMAGAYAKVINNAYRTRVRMQRDDVQLISEQINTSNKDIIKTRTLLLKEEIDARDYREIKQENETRITVLEAKLIEISAASTNIGPQLVKAVHVLSHLNELYTDGGCQKETRHHQFNLSGKNRF